MNFKPQLMLLQHFLGLSPSSITSKDDDVVFVAVDFENTQNLLGKFRPRHECQVGISILDTRDLASSPETAIKTHNFISGSRVYCAANSQRFCFGDSVAIYYHAIRKVIESLLDRERKIVLVGHDIRQEILVLHSIHFDLDSSIVGYLDTQLMTMELLDLPTNHCLSLKGLIKCFGGIRGYSPSMLHNAGNDANFTMRVLLLIAEKSVQGTVLADAAQFWKPHAILAIARSPITVTPFYDTLPETHKACREAVKHQKRSSLIPLANYEIKCKGANWSGYFVLRGTSSAPRQLQIRAISKDNSSDEYIKIERQIPAERRQRSLAKNKDIFIGISD